MNNPIENTAVTYVLFGDEAVSIYRISIKHLLKAEDLKFTVGEYSSVKEFFIEKNKWDNYIEIDYKNYATIKSHLDRKHGINKKGKKRFSFFNLFQ